MVLVDLAGKRTGVAGLVEAHTHPGLLHLAVSVMLRSSSGWVVQQRSSCKRLFAGAWADSCCTHPFPGESTEAAARRRVRDELGVAASRLLYCGAFLYQAQDPMSGLPETDFDHVYVGTITADADLQPNANEIDDVKLLDLDDAYSLLRESGAPWASTVLELAALRAGEPREP